jgi:hypothetical protein
MRRPFQGGQIQIDHIDHNNITRNNRNFIYKFDNLNIASYDRLIGHNRMHPLIVIFYEAFN